MSILSESELKEIEARNKKAPPEGRWRTQSERDATSKELAPVLGSSIKTSEIMGNRIADLEAQVRELTEERGRANTACLTYHAILCEQHKNDSLGWTDGHSAPYMCAVCRIFRVEREAVESLESFQRRAVEAIRAFSKAEYQQNPADAAIFVSEVELLRRAASLVESLPLNEKEK